MQPIQFALLSLMTLVFIFWVFLMFRMLWRLTKQSMDRLDETGGGYFTWAGHSMRAFSGFLTDPGVKNERRQLLIVTILLFAIIIAQPIILSRM